jgi:hypothetical protein
LPDRPAGPADAAEQILRRSLEGDERILWTGRPEPAALVRVERKWRAGGLALVLIALWIAWRTEALPLAALVAAFGVNALTLPWRAARAAPGILYAVTDKRVLIIDPARLQPVQPYPFTALKLQLRQAAGTETGDLLLRRRDFFPAAIEGVARQRRPVFHAIRDPVAVAELIRRQAVRFAHAA